MSYYSSLNAQRYDLQPAEYCKKLKLPAPMSVSAKNGTLANLYQLLVAVAFLPYNPNKEQKRATSRRITSFLITAAGIAVASIVAYRFYKQQTITQ
jgi:hypothetical protein